MLSISCFSDGFLVDILEKFLKNVKLRKLDFLLAILEDGTLDYRFSAFSCFFGGILLGILENSECLNNSTVVFKNLTRKVK